MGFLLMDMYYDRYTAELLCDNDLSSSLVLSVEQFYPHAKCNICDKHLDSNVASDCTCYSYLSKTINLAPTKHRSMSWDSLVHLLVLLTWPNSNGFVVIILLTQQTTIRVIYRVSQLVVYRSVNRYIFYIPVCYWRLSVDKIGTSTITSHMRNASSC